MSRASPARLVRMDLRYTRLERLIERFRHRSSVAFNLQVGESNHFVEWPTDFSEYRVMASRYPETLHFTGRGDFPEVEVLRSHLLKGDFDLLTYYTCSCRSDKYLQNSQDRMDWFFALDYFVDGPSTPPELREEVVRDLTVWVDDRSHRSRFPWVNALNSVLGLILEDLERDGIDTAEIRRETRGYYQGFLAEYHESLPLQGYLENRSFTDGMRPEIAFCFAYLGRPLPSEDRDAAETLKELSAYLVAIHNDTVSQRKEELTEQGHLNLKAYFPDSEEYVSFLCGLYREKYSAFRSMRPASPGPLADLWWVCNQWICGSIVWHLTSRRYDLGQFEILG